MKSYLKICVISIAIMSPVVSMATGYLVKNATVTFVTNTSGNSDQFQITTSGGTGTCANTNIFFRPYNTNPEAYARAFVIATIAVTSNLKVDVYNYGSDTCTEGAFIGVRK